MAIGNELLKDWSEELSLNVNNIGRELINHKKKRVIGLKKKIKLLETTSIKMKTIGQSLHKV